MEKFRALFRNLPTNRPAIIGMIHLLPLPGTPYHKDTIDIIVDRACNEALLYNKYALDGVIVENMNDVPYLNGSVGSEIVSTMTRICTEVKKVIGTMSLGVQVLSAANKEALSIAHSSGANFIRVEGYVYSHIGDEGWIDSCAGQLLRHRKLIGADNVLIWSDIKKKHSSNFITSDVSIEDTVQSAQFFRSDGVIITGQATGHCANISDVYKAIQSTDLPVLIGSGVTASNIDQYRFVNGLIIGSYFKRNGQWYNELDEERLYLLMETINK